MSSKNIIISLIIFILSSGILYLWLSLGGVDTLLKETTIIETNKESKSTISGESGINRPYNSFVMEGENVYWIDRNFPEKKNTIIGADSQTFELLNECKHQGCYAKDKSRVYLLSEIMRVVGLEIIGEANPNTFRILTGSYSRDENNIFCNWNKISGIDLAAFRTIGYGFTDNKSVYWECNKLEGIDDPKSLMFTENGGDGILQDQNFIYQIKGIGPEEIQVEKIAKNISFSPSQVSEILTKIDKNTKKQEELRKNATGILIQGEYKAEYINSKIKITIQGKSHELTQSYLGLNGFIEFSPSGYYILCSISRGDKNIVSLIDINSGKEVLSSMENIFYSWSPNNKQFIYGENYGSSISYGFMKEGERDPGGLWITQRGKFPKVDSLSLLRIQGAYIDKDYLYTRMKPFTNTPDKLVIYNLTTLKEVFSQEIK